MMEWSLQPNEDFSFIKNTDLHLASLPINPKKMLTNCFIHKISKALA